MYDENISADQIVSPGGMICVGASWVDKPGMFFFSDWEDGHKRMLQGIHDLMSEADAVLTYNGDRFDLPKLNGEFLLNGLKPLPPLTSIDVYKQIKQFGFDMNSLKFVGPHLMAGEKLRHEGFSLWAKVLDGDEKAMLRMEKYCLQDVRLLIRVYKKILPFIVNHPHMGSCGVLECGACGSAELQSRGYRRTKAFKIQRIQCVSCGAWQDGSRQKV